MSVLLELSIFPLDKGESLSAFIAPVVDLIRSSDIPYQLTAMGTLVETEELAEALALVERANALLQEQGCRRIHATVKLDIREGPTGRLAAKVESVQRRMGDLPA